MTRKIRSRWVLGLAMGAVLPLAAFGVRTTVAPVSDFTSPTIDLGVVVGDLDAAVEFYGKIVGMKEVPGFSVPAEFCRDAGLTDGHPLTVRVLVCTDDPQATRLKLMQLPGVKSKPGDHRFIHSQLGFSYLTMRVGSLAPILERLEEAGRTVLAKGPVPLGEAGADGQHLALIADPDGNLVELIGPLE